MRCGQCGSKNTELKNIKGRGFPYKMYDKVIVTVDCDLTCCNECDNIMLKSNDCKRLDEAIESSLSDSKKL